MSQQIDNMDSIRRYLLGELSEEEQQQVERRLLSDDDYYQQVLVAEDELIYDFVFDELPSQDKARFNQHVLPVPERRQDVRFARSLKRYVGERAPSLVKVSSVEKERASWLKPFAAFFRRPIVGFSLSAALLLMLSISVWIAIQNRRLQNHLAELQAQQTPTPMPQDIQEQLASERRRNADLRAELLREQEQRANVERNLEVIKAEEKRRASSGPPARTTVATVLSLFLTSGGDRGSGEFKKISLAGGAREVRLQLDLAANAYSSYRAVLKTVEGQKELLSKKMLRAHVGKSRITVTLNLPAKLLSRGDYQIQLGGENSAGEYEDVDTYYFRVVE